MHVYTHSYIVLAYIVMAYIVEADIVMTYIVMALRGERIACLYACLYTFVRVCLWANKTAGRKKCSLISGPKKTRKLFLVLDSNFARPLKLISGQGNRRQIYTSLYLFTTTT